MTGAAAPADPRFAAAIDAIDAVNAGDPHRERDGSGREIAGALLYGRRMSARVRRLAPDAPEALRLAARAQHIGRWQIPRASYPPGREGYLAWRSALARFHAETAGRILRDAGYGEEMIARVSALLRKRNLRRDADAQVLEDAACLVFLEHDFTDFSRRHPDDKVIDILRKTAAKMSDRGRAEAGRLIEGLPPDRRALAAGLLSVGRD